MADRRDASVKIGNGPLKRIGNHPYDGFKAGESEERVIELSWLWHLRSF